MQLKKIEVKGFEVKNFRGTDSYLFLEKIILSSKKPPMAKIEFEIAFDKSINRETRILAVGDDLYHISKEMNKESRANLLLQYHKTAILLSAMVLIVTVASMLFAKHPAIKSVGFATLVGMISAVVIAYVVQPYLFRKLNK